jgi:asparagine synthase (glutamine-hydrolysing)
LRSWISGDLKEMVNDLLSENQVRKRGIFNPAFISKLIENDRKGFHDNAYQIYQLLTIEIWMQQFFDA